MGAMRAKDYRICTQNALAMYFSKAAAANDRTKAMSYGSHLESIDRNFAANDIRTGAKTHIGRRSGAQMAEMDNVAELQIRRAGRWNMSVMEFRYLNHLP